MVQKFSLLLVIGTAILMQTACSVDPTDDDEKSAKNDAKDKKIELKTLKDSASYALGVNIVQNFRNQGLTENIDKDVFMAALEKQFASEENLMDMKEASQIIKKQMSQASKKDNAGKLEEGKKFLDKNAKREEVKVTESGLQYEIIKEGSGETPSVTSKVKTHYEGRLIDGTKFDSSYDRGKPATFPVNGVIKGWQEALQLMKPGAKWKLYIPYDLAYGERGQGDIIGPYETLIFDIELIEIVE